jgi:CelD/BcsL family acetyltransferase involved in cellulose biosynthesis
MPGGLDGLARPRRRVGAVQLGVRPGPRRALAPGIVLVNQLIELAAEDGCHVFDLLRGDEAYKYRFGAIDRPVERLTIVRP